MSEFSLLSMRSEIALCVFEYNRKVVDSFRKLCQANSTTFENSAVDEHNTWLLSSVGKNVSSSSVLRSMAFLLYSPNFPMDTLYTALTNIENVTPNYFFFKVMKNINRIFAKDTQKLLEFVFIAKEKGTKCIHFAAIGPTFAMLDMETAGSVIRMFTTAALQFSHQELLATKEFIRGIHPQLFIAYFKPFLDQQFLRNPAKFILRIEYLMRPLNFGISRKIPHSGQDFMDTISGLCESRNSDAVAEAQRVVEFLATRISPSVFPMRSKSMIYYFGAAPITAAGVRRVFELLETQILPTDSKTALLWYLVRAVHVHPFFDINMLLTEHLIPNKLWMFVYLSLDVENIDRQLVLQYAKSENVHVCAALQLRLGEHTKLSTAGISHVCGYQNEIMSLVTADILYRVRKEMPAVAGRMFFVGIVNSPFCENIIAMLEKSLEDCPKEFLDEFFGLFDRRKAQKLRILAKTLSKFSDKFSPAQKVWCIEIGVKIQDDDPELVRGLFEKLKGDWKKDSEAGLNMLIERPECHKEISAQLLMDETYKQYGNLLANLLKHFEAESDQELLDAILSGVDVNPELFVTCFNARQQYKDCVMTLLACFTNVEAIACMSRERLFSLIPKKNMSEFDFLVFVEFYPYLLHTTEWDNICEFVCQQIIRFNYLSFRRTAIAEQLREFTEADEVLLNIYLSDNEIVDHQIAKRIACRPKFAEMFYERREEYGDLRNTYIPAAFTIHGKYMPELPSFQVYLNQLLTLGYQEDVIVNAISEWYSTVETPSSMMPHLLSLGKSHQMTYLRELSRLSKSFVKGYEEQIFAVFMDLKPKDYDADTFNYTVERLLVPEISDHIIDTFLAKPSFGGMPPGAIRSLLIALRTSKRPVMELFELIKSQSTPRISDETIEILLECMRVLHEVSQQTMTEMANGYVRKYEETNPETLALVYSISSIPNKVTHLSKLLISDTDKTKALVILKYMLNSAGRSKYIQDTLQSLIELAAADNSKVVEAANRALRVTIPYLDKATVIGLVPTIISTLKPDSTRYGIENGIQCLIDVETRYELSFIDHLPVLFSVQSAIKSENLDALWHLIEDHLTNSEKPILFRVIIRNIRANSPVELLRAIEENIDQTKDDAILARVCYSLIEKSLTGSDLSMRLLSFKILSCLVIPESLFDKTLDFFYQICADTDKNGMYQYFDVYVNRLCAEDKMRVYTEFMHRGASMKEFETSGFAVLFGIVILATNNEFKTFDKAMEVVRETKNSLFRDALMGSFLTFLQRGKNDAVSYIIPTVKCCLNHAEQADSTSTRILTDLIKILPASEGPSFLELLPDFMISKNPNVRKMCITCLINYFHTVHRQSSSNKSLRDVLGDDLFFKIAVPCFILTFDAFTKDQATRITSVLFNGPSYNTAFFTPTFIMNMRKFILVGENDPMKACAIDAINSIMNEQRRTKEYESTDAVITAWAEICGDEFEKQIESALNKMKKDLSCYVASRLCYVDVSNDFRSELCCVIIQLILDSQKYIESLSAAFKKWRDKLAGDPTKKVLASLYSMSRSQPPRPASCDITEESQSTDRAPRSTRSDILIGGVAGDAFINICVTAFDMEIFNTYISKKLEYGPDMLIIHLIETLAKQTPQYFLEECDEDLWRFVSLLSMNDVQSRVEDVLLEVMNNLETTDSIGAFLARLSRVLMKLKTTPGLLSDRFVLAVVDKFLKSPMIPSFALFVRVMFQIISNTVKMQITSQLLEYLTKNAMINPGDDMPDIVGAVTLLGPQIETLGCHYIVSVFNTALYHPISTSLFCELLSCIKSALSVGISTVCLLNLLMTRNSITPCAEILELIAFVLDVSKEAIDTQLLMQISKIADQDLDLSSVSEKMKAGKVKVIVNVAIRLSRSEMLKLFDRLLHTHGLDLTIISCFITTLGSIEYLSPNQVQIIKKAVLVADASPLVFISAVPILLASENTELVVELLHFLVKGLAHDGCLPVLCLDQLTKARDVLPKLAISEASIVISGIYLAYTREGTDRMKQRFREIITAILGTPGKENSFRDSYLRTLDVSLAQALHRDFGYVLP